LPKLLLDSWGTLALILEVTFRLYPYPAPELKERITQPFVMTALHRRIKGAFDPGGLLSQELTNLTADDVRHMAERPKGPVADESFKNMEDRFWG
jgi:hypothetical protein